MPRDTDKRYVHVLCSHENGQARRWVIASAFDHRLTAEARPMMFVEASFTEYMDAVRFAEGFARGVKHSTNKDVEVIA